MKKLILILSILCVCMGVKAQVPHKKVYHDTIKTVSERVEYEPDTIPVYFKEVRMGEFVPFDVWQSGFVVWQTYETYPRWSFSQSGTISTTTINVPSYYKDDYEFTKSMPGKFLYADKTPCKNTVIYSIKR